MSRTKTIWNTWGDRRLNFRRSDGYQTSTSGRTSERPWRATNPAGNMLQRSDGRVRTWATAEAAMNAVDKMFPFKDCKS